MNTNFVIIMKTENIKLMFSLLYNYEITANNYREIHYFDIVNPIELMKL